MDVITALDHPWLTRRLMIDQDEFMITTDRLRNSYNSYISIPNYPNYILKFKIITKIIFQISVVAI